MRLPCGQVIDNEICFKASVHSNIYELYHCRARMHSDVYNHRRALLIYTSLRQSS